MKPYYSDEAVTIYHGDCREVLPTLIAADLALVDPPYGETSLEWDTPVGDWVRLIRAPQMWCFGSLQTFLGKSLPRWRVVQDLVWEKHNGSNFHADRFKRVHELVVHFVRAGIAWSDLYHSPVTTNDATRRTVRRKERPQHHLGKRGPSNYRSVDGGPRLMRSVIKVRSCHGYAEHPTQKPVGILIPLIEYSCPPGGVVLDPFVGSGSTLEAARLTGRKAIGIEIEERYCEIAAKRMAQEVLALDYTPPPCPPCRHPGPDCACRDALSIQSATTAGAHSEEER